MIIESMNKSKLKKKPELQDQLYVGNYIDAYHIQSKVWRIAHIIGVKDKEVEINYDGTTKKFNETIKTTSSKLAFCRRMTQAYTGDDYRGNKTSRDYIKYSNELCSQRTKELKDIIKTSFEGMSALEISQNVRVRQFLFLDLLLSSECQLDEIPVAMEYIKAYIQFIAFYFDLLPQYYSDYIRGQTNADLFITDERVSIALCYTEVCESFCMLFGSIWRVLKTENSFFYLNFTGLSTLMDTLFPSSPVQFQQVPNIADWNLYQGATDIIKCIKKTWPIYLKIMGFFQQIGGLTAWENLLKVNEGAECPSLPLRALAKYYLTQMYMITYYTAVDQSKIAKTHLEYLDTRVQNLTNQEIKDAEIDTIKDVISEHSILFKKFYQQEQLDKFVEEHQLLIALKFLKSQFLEKRVKGVTEIKDLTEKVEVSQVNYNFTKAKLITKEYMIKWIRDNQILELLLLGDSIHPELVKRCVDIAVFLSKNNSFQNDMIEKIWQQNVGKHETTQLAVYDLFKQLSQYLSQEGIDRLYALISQIPLIEYNEMTISLVKTFTEHALQKKNNDSKKFYGFNQLWDLLQDRNDGTPSGIQDHAFQAARSIVSNIPQSKVFLQTFFAKCFDLIREHTSVYQAISFLHYILDKQFTDDQQGKKQIVKFTNDKYQIVELFVKDIEVYLEKARQFFKDKPTSDVIISGVQNFQQNMFFRLQMLNYLLQMQEIRISHEQLLRLWDTIAVKTKGSIQKKELTKVLYTGTLDSNITIQQRFFSEKDGQQKFFLQTLCQSSQCDYPNFTSEEFDLFQVFFRTFNSQKQSIKIIGNFNNTSGKILVKDFQKVDGLDALWEIFAQVKDQKVLESVSNLLVSLYTSFISTVERTTIQSIQKALMDKCLASISSTTASHQLTARCINLILQLFNVFQNGIQSSAPPSKKSTSKNSTSVVFKASIVNNDISQSKLQEFKEIETLTLEQWKRKVAEQSGVGYKQVEIEIDNKKIEDDYDLSQQTIGKWSSQRKISVIVLSSYHPKNYISQNPNSFNLLFKLLNSSNQTVQFSNQVWELISKLPINNEVKDQVKQMKQSWKSLLDDTFYRSLYNIQIVSDLTFSDTEWSKKFIESGGLKCLISKYKTLQNSFSSNPLDKTCALKFTQLLNYYLGVVKSEWQAELQTKVISVVQSLCDDLNQREQSLKDSDSQLQQSQVTITKKNKVKSEVQLLHDLESNILKESLKLLYNNSPAKLNGFFSAESATLISRLQVLLVDNDNPTLKKEFVAALLVYNFDTQILLTLLTGPLIKWVVTSSPPKQKSEHFWELICELFKRESEQNLTQYGIVFEDLTQNLITQMRELPIYELTPKDQDQVLIGLLRILQVMTEKYMPLKQKAGQQMGLLKDIFSFLIQRGQPITQLGTKFKSPQSRQAAFSCLLTLLKDQQNLTQFQRFIQPLHLTSLWRSKQFTDWNIQSKFNDKSSTGYVGLYNLGCICYMNSLMQQLFMIPSFREALLKVDNMVQVNKEDNLLFQLKCLFLALKHSQKQYHNPKKFCHAFKDISNQPTNIFEQMDVDEFCNLLMDRIEASIKGSSNSDFVKRNFGGILSNEIIGKTCPHYSEREEPFFALSLAVKNKKNIEQCLQAMIQGDLLEGDNAYYCEKCQKKVNAVKRMCLKKLPNHLIVVLKRFDFDFDLMTKAKINDKCEFPFKLDLQQYSQQGLRVAENVTSSDEPHPNQYFEYKLSGVVIHQGSADSGHYYSFIQEREKDVPEDKGWYEFNDIFVTHIDQKDIITEGYGGEKQVNSKSKMMLKDKSKNAYLLFYERIEKLEDIQQPTQQIIQVEESRKQQQNNNQAQASMVESQMLIESDTPTPNPQEQIDIEEFLREIYEENDKFAIQRFIFNSEYFNFMQLLMKQQELVSNPDPQIIKVILVFYFACSVRESERSWITNNITEIKTLLMRCPSVCQWLLNAFTQPQYIREFQLECPIKMVRKQIIILIEAAIIVVSAIEGFQKIYEVTQEDQPASIVGSLINQWILMIREIRGSARYFPEFFDLFYRFACLSPDYAKYLLSKRLVGRLLDFYIDTVIQNNTKKQLLPHQDEIRRTEDIRTLQQVFTPQEYFGQLSQYVTEASSHYDDLLEKKLEKNINYQIYQSRAYLWRTIAHLLKDNKASKDAKASRLTTDETELLYQDQSFYVILLEEGDNKLAIRAIADIFMELSWDNQKYSEILLSAVHKSIVEKEYKEYRKYFVVMKRLLNLKDQYQDFRINYSISQLLSLMQKQTQYFFETDVCQQYIIRMSAKNQPLAKWMQLHQSQWQWFMENIASQTVPNEKLMQNNQNTMKCLHRLHGIYLPLNPLAYKKHLAWKKSVFTQLYKAEPLQVPTTDFDSDDDLSDLPLKAGDKIDYYHNESHLWLPAVIDRVIEDQIQITYTGGKVSPATITIERDNERLAPSATLSVCNKVPGYTESPSPQVIQNSSQVVAENDNDTEEGNYGSHASSESDDNN